MRELYKNLGKVGISLGGNYNPKVVYKEKTAVYDEINNRTYVSKKDVPVGIELNNEEYWQLIIKGNKSTIEILDELGNSSTSAISQRIVTEELDKKLNKKELEEEGGYSQISSNRPIVDYIVEVANIKSQSVQVNGQQEGEGVVWVIKSQCFAYRIKNIKEKIAGGIYTYYNNWVNNINREASLYKTSLNEVKQNIYIYNNEYYTIDLKYEFDEIGNKIVSKSFNKLDLATNNNYPDLTNKPSINGIELNGNKSANDLKLVEAIRGKQLSDENYSTNEKDQLAKLWEKANPITLSVDISNSLFKKGTSNTVTVSWTVKKGDLKVTPSKVTINGVSVDASLGKKEYTNVSTNTTYNVIATYNSKNLERSVSVVFVNNSYCGVVNDNFVINEQNVKALTLSLKNTKSYETTLTLNNQKICYAYPALFGELSKILDGNGFECINGYTKTIHTINGESYNVYLKNTSTSIINYKQKFL